MNDDVRILREVVEQTFDLTDVCPRYSKETVGATNVFCVFHDNRNTPSAKLYYDEDRGITVLHCFAEHRTYTAYDYVDKVLVQQKHKFSSVQDFLLRNLGEQKFNELYKLAEQESYLENETVCTLKIARRLLPELPNKKL